MALVLFILFCYGMLNRNYMWQMECHTYAMTNGKAIMCGSKMLYRMCWIIQQMLYLIVPRLCILCHLVSRMLLCLVYYVCPLPLLPNIGHLPMLIDWIPTAGHGRFSQNLVMSHDTSLVGRNLRKMAHLWPRQMLKPLGTVLRCYTELAE